MKTLVRFAACRAGATAVEYSLIAGLVALAIVSAVQSVGEQVQVPLREVEAGFKQGQ